MTMFSIFLIVTPFYLESVYSLVAYLRKTAMGEGEKDEREYVQIIHGRDIFDVVN